MADSGKQIAHTKVKRMHDLLLDVGANRYWEGRWRDADAENARLQEFIWRLIDSIRTGDRESIERYIDEWIKMLADRNEKAAPDSEGG